MTVGKFDHDLYARSKPHNDFWGQVRRSVRGEPVDSDQIGMIVRAIRDSLKLVPNDYVVDVGCGNGALAAEVLPPEARYLGVDSAPYLIEVAKKNFRIPGRREFLEQDICEFLRNQSDSRHYTKVLCYGAFSYFAPKAAQALLRWIFDEAVNVTRVFIGNLPDYERAHLFFEELPLEEVLRLNTTATGIWRTRDEFREFAASTGWNCKLSKMQSSFYAAHYRFDAVLTRA